MIRINLLGVERQTVRKPVTFDIPHRLTVLCSLILVGAALGIGWWYSSLAEESARVDRELAAAQEEAARLQSVLVEVQQFEAQRAQLQLRVTLIEQLRNGQSVPVLLLDHVSRSLPDMLWLTQFERKGDAIVIQGLSTTLIALSDFVANLAETDLLQRPIDIVTSQVETAAAVQGEPAAEVIRFTVQAQMAPLAVGVASTLQAAATTGTVR